MQVDGDLDLATVPQLRSGLQQALDGGAGTMELDFTGVRFLDSTALGMIVWLHKEVQQRGGRVYVVGAPPLVLRVLTLTSMVLGTALKSGTTFSYAWHYANEPLLAKVGLVATGPAGRSEQVAFNVFHS